MAIDVPDVTPRRRRQWSELKSVADLTGLRKLARGQNGRLRWRDI